MSATIPVNTGRIARLRRERRHRTGIAVSVVLLSAFIAAFVVMTIGYQDSWWTSRDPAPSSDQVASDGSSTFTQAGIDYFTTKGVVDIAMTADRPSASGVGLGASAKHIDFLVPLTLQLAGSSTVKLDEVTAVDLIPGDGKLSTVEVPIESDFAGLDGQVHALATRFGWSPADLTAFDAALAASRRADDYQGYSATIGPETTGGMAVSATLSADQTQSPTLVIRFVAPR